MSDVLEEILVARRKSLQRAKNEVSLDELDRLTEKMPAPLKFKQALNQKGALAVIAELKRRSPSAGEIRENFSVPKIAEAFKKGGARALSVLTEADFFGGDVLFMKQAKDASGLPILRKDFIFDPYQIAEARAFGADAVLLIADMLDSTQLKELVNTAFDYQVEPLVEFFTSNMLEPVLASGAEVIGINNRNLRTLKMFPTNVENLSGMVPKDRIVVAESGIKTPAEIKAIKSLSVKAVLVGESLLKQKDLEKAVRRLVEAA